MKNSIKAILFLLVFVVISFPSFSQFKVGVKAGLNIASIHQNFISEYAEVGEIDNPVPRLLYTVGPSVDISFGDMFSLQPALLLSGKGVGIDVEDEYDGVDKGYARWTIHYLEIPINVAFKFKGFQVYAGPYIGTALSGKVKWHIEADGETDSGSETLKFYTKEVDTDDIEGDGEEEAIENFFRYYFKRFDYGLNIGAGYKLGPVLLSAGYSLGLANLTPGVTDTGEVDFDPKDALRSTRTFTLSATYYFGKWKE